MKYYEAVKWAREALRAASFGEAEAQGRQLALGILHLTEKEYLLARDRILDSAEQKRLAQGLSRRLSGEPLQYILGQWEFCGLTFKTDARALIPREETELLVRAAQREFLRIRRPRIIDLGTGTGCIGLTLAHLLPEAEVTCCDVSPDALDLARENGERLGLGHVRYLLWDMREVLPDGPYDGIVSNPPYIPEGEIPSLQAEVRREPEAALSGGADGLRFYRALAARMEDSLTPEGVLLCELGRGQAGEVTEILRPHSGSVSLTSDMAGIPRVLCVRKNREMEKAGI